MKTAEEMMKFIEENELGTGSSKKWNLRHLEVIENNLNDGEEVLLCFIGLHNYESATKHNNNFAYAITDSRFIMGQKKMIGENVQTVLRENLNDVTKSTGMIFGVITFDTFKEKFRVGVDSLTIDRIYESINNTLFKAQEKEDADLSKLVQLKELHDMGILSEEEFNIKKQEILDKI